VEELDAIANRELKGGGPTDGSESVTEMASSKSTGEASGRGEEEDGSRRELSVSRVGDPSGGAVTADAGS
jgi:hypothetical protein